MKKMTKGLKQLKDDWESAAKRKDYRFSIYSNPDFSEPIFDKSGTTSLNILLDILESWNVDISDKTVVDYGCGAGRVTKYIAQVARKVIGTDISEKMIDRFKQRLGKIENVDLFTGSGKDLRPLEDGSVDIIYSLWVFQHIPEKIVPKIVEDCYRVLKEGGLLIFQMALDKKHRAGVYEPLPACSLAHWTKKEVKKMCRDMGFNGYNEYRLGGNDYFTFQK